MPWLFYKGTPETLLKETIDLRVAFNAPANSREITDSLKYYLARYNITGHFSGEFTELKT